MRIKGKNLQDLKRVGVTATQVSGTLMAIFPRVLNCVLTPDQGSTCWDQLECLFLI